MSISTSSFVEAKSIITAGWQYEHVGWNAPSTGDPVYRLYNPNAGDHHFTLNSNEKVMLVNQGWRDEECLVGIRMLKNQSSFTEPTILMPNQAAT